MKIWYFSPENKCLTLCSSELDTEEENWFNRPTFHKNHEGKAKAFETKQNILFFAYFLYHIAILLV